MNTTRRIGHCGCTLMRAGTKWLIQHAVCEHHKAFTHAPQIRDQEPPDFLRKREEAPMRTMAFALRDESDVAEEESEAAHYDERVRFTPAEKATIIAALRRYRSSFDEFGDDMANHREFCDEILSKIK